MKIALITGASQGIGSAIAQELNQKKIPFIVQRRVSSENIELWKLEDLKII